MAQYSRKLSKGIRWWYKFDFKGITYNSDCIYLSKNEAKKGEADKLKEVSTLMRNPSLKVEIGLLEAINERLDDVKVKKSIDYFKDNKRYYSELLNRLGDVPLSSITRKDINDFLLEQATKAKEEGRDNYAVNYRMNIIKTLFNYAIESHELPMRNPCAKITPFSVKKKLKYIPSDKDIEAVKELCDEEQKKLIDFVSETAARINEPLQVTGKDLFDDYVILYTKKSRNSNVVPRKVPRPSCLQGIHILPDEKLFGNWSDTPKFLKRKIKMLNQKQWNWHNLRHRRASLWSKQGMPIYDIMSLLGHSSLKTTQKYLQLIG